MRKKLHIHSDCYKWGGGENMVGVFLQDKGINESFDVSFSYRCSPEYEEGMRKWVSDLAKDDCELCDQKTVCSGVGEPSSSSPAACLRIDPVRRPSLYPFHLPITKFYRIKRFFPLIMVLGYFSAIVDIVKMLKLFRRVKSDILHIINGGYPGAISCNMAAIAGKLAGIPKITYFINSTTRNPWWAWPMTWAVRRSVTRFMSASKYLKNHSPFLYSGSDSGSNWVNISNTMRPHDPVPRERVRERLDIPKDEVVFLCMGDLVERKGFYRAIEALSTMKSEGIPRSLLMVGDGPERAFLSNMAKHKKKGVYRIFTETGLHPYDVINACDVVLVPSIGEEDWPNVILIAMMYGKPIITSNILGFCEMVEHGHTGYLSRTTSDLRDYMDMLLDEDLRCSMGQRAGARYEQRYRIDKILGRYLELWSIL